MDLNQASAVELFAGIGGFRLALDSHGIKTVWANDLDAKAALIYKSRFGPAHFHEGDIRKLHDTIPTHDLLTAGFPCQPFSSAGKKRGIADPRGTLFQEIVLALKKHAPDVFILENVKRLLMMEDGIHFATILAALGELEYQIEWRLINAMHLGLPQNRQRLIILGINKRNCLERPHDPNQVYLVPKNDFEDLPSVTLEKLHKINKWKNISDHDKSFPNWGIAEGARFFGCDLQMFSDSKTRVLLREILEANPDDCFDFTEATKSRLMSNVEVNRFVGGVEIISNQGGGARMGYTIFGVDGVAPTLTAATSRHYERYKIGDRYRRLTNVEYARIQGFPDTHCSEVSVYDQYGLFGNAVPPAIIKWVLHRIRHGGEQLPRAKIQQLELIG